MHSGKPELRHHQQSFLPQTSLVLSATGSLELRLASSAILEHTNNNTSHSWLGLVIVSNDRRTRKGPDATLNTEIHKNSVRIEAPNSVNASKRKHKNQINHCNKQRRVLMANSTVCQSKWKPIVEPRPARLKTYRQAPTHWLKFSEEAVIESEARTAVCSGY